MTEASATITTVMDDGAAVTDRLGPTSLADLQADVAERLNTILADGALVVSSPHAARHYMPRRILHIDLQTEGCDLYYRIDEAGETDGTT